MYSNIDAPVGSISNVRPQHVDYSTTCWDVHIFFPMGGGGSATVMDKIGKKLYIGLFFVDLCKDSSDKSIDCNLAMVNLSDIMGR